jgi:hypothetical protein
MVEEQSISADVSFHKSNVELVDCSFIGKANTLLDISLASAGIVGCSFKGGSDQVELHYVRARLGDARFMEAADDAVSVEGGTLEMRTVSISGARGIGAKAVSGAVVNATAVAITDVAQGIEVRPGASLTMFGGSINAAQAGVVASKATMRDGAARIVLDEVRLNAGEAPTVCGEGSSITVDGKEVGGGTSHAAAASE